MCFVCVQANADSEEYAGHIDSSKSYATDNSVLSVDYGSAGNIPTDTYLGLLYGEEYQQIWRPDANGNTVVRFSFDASEKFADGMSTSRDSVSFTAAEQAVALGAMAKMSAIANITFVNVTGHSNAQLIFSKNNLESGGLMLAMGDGRGYYSNAQVLMEISRNADMLTEGTQVYQTLLHELGHAVGLKHPHGIAPIMNATYDHNDYTVMSYKYDLVDYRDNSFATNYQILDQQALHHLYGVSKLPPSNEKILSDNNDAYTIAGAAENVKGGWGIDTLVGGAGNDTIYGGKSQADPDDQGDIIRGEGGNDIIFGNGGNDNIQGNAGLDTIWGGRGFDTIYGNDGDDSLAGGGGIEHPDDESDTIYGGAGNDSIIGNGGDDLVYGEAGNDTFWGGYGNDTFYGGDGNDLIMGQFGNDSLIGGAGNDTFYFYNANHNDTIADFAFGDIIRLDRNINNSGIQSAQDAANFATYSAGVAILDFGGGHVINVVTAAPLTAQSFEII